MNDLARFNKQYGYFLCVVDNYSQYAFVKLLKNKTAQNVMQKFESILLTTKEIAKKIQCDEGMEFQKIRNELSKNMVLPFFTCIIKR